MECCTSSDAIDLGLITSKAPKELKRIISQASKSINNLIVNKINC